ncbi:serine/threonine dehydratase [Nocardia sp. XZ_19_369]|uniref:serine/threonine dehydratase n=1 Tax=Nocardia sp. XZ_19_369 TaxID=2769487 RepID=UPI001890167B|nr:serine/threonine dehydratase [Nocardia sp. XZ_19_369]
MESDGSKLTYGDVEEASRRIGRRVRPVTLAPMDARAITGSESGQVWLALEYMQHTGSVNARGALNFLRAHKQDGSLPDAGVTIASGGNAGLAFAWAARVHGVPAKVFLPCTAPQVTVDRLAALGAHVEPVGDEDANAVAACEAFAASTGALKAHPYDHPLIAGGAGTLLDEIRGQLPQLNTVVVAVGGGALFAGVATAAEHHGVHTVAVEPESSRALYAALDAGAVVDVDVDSVAADSPGVRRISEMALYAAQNYDVTPLLVTDHEITLARRALWDHRRIVVEHGGATALAALWLSGRYLPRQPDETVCVVLCGANTDPSDLAR